MCVSLKLERCHFGAKAFLNPHFSELGRNSNSVCRRKNNEQARIVLSSEFKTALLSEKFTWGNKAKHCRVMSTNFVDKPYQCLPYTPQANFPAYNLSFYWRWRWWDWIQATFQNLFYFREPSQITWGG